MTRRPGPAGCAATPVRLDRPARRRAIIGLTPLIDVVFILLLFFMLTTRFGQPQAMSLRMPGEGTAASDDASIDVVVLRLNEDATVGLPDGRDLPQAALGTDAAVAALLADAVPVRLEVDDAADLQSVVTLLDRFEAIGLVDVAVRGLGR